MSDDFEAASEHSDAVSEHSDASVMSKTTYIQQPTTGCPQARLDLPGLNLPLNWTPHEKYSQYQSSTTVVFFEFPAQGDGANLYPTALDNVNMGDGYCA